MCLAADRPLIESGTQGYLGQVFAIRKDVTGQLYFSQLDFEN
jgi:ubiquitin-like 1-activating enzyme E1 B